MNRVVVNIGNSRIVCGIFVDNKLVDLAHYISQNTEQAAINILQKANAMKLFEITLASVVPESTKKMTDYFRAQGKDCLLIKAENQTAIKNVYPTLGVDRIANLAGALKLHVRSHSAVVIDLGTATTLTVCDHEGNFQGGMITLGLAKTYSALYENTALLPNLEMDVIERKPYPLATDTESAIASGCILGHAGIIENWIRAVKHELDQRCTVIATGGFAGIIGKYTKAFDQIDPDLTMYGINFIAEAGVHPMDQG
jgi:type III pantothenate kinase